VGFKVFSPRAYARVGWELDSLAVKGIVVAPIVILVLDVPTDLELEVRVDGNIALIKATSNLIARN
jgi:hypothetical protein